MISSDADVRAGLDAVLARPPVGLLLDIDGTISPIAPTPQEAAVPDPIRALLRRLAVRLPLVAAISGRAAADAAQMVGVPEMIYIGNHGLEMLRGGQIEPLPEAVAYQGKIGMVMHAAQSELPLAGLLFEDKGLSASVHYRLADDPDTARVQVGAVLERLTAEHGLRLTAGRMVWELRPPLAANKGTAVRWVVGTYQLNGAIFCGDDRTDADAFRVLDVMRSRHDLAALNVGVAATETPREVLEGADVLVDGVPGMQRLLAMLARLAGA